MKRQITAAISITVASLLLVSCAGGELVQAQNTSVEGTSFSKALYAGYLKLAEGEFREGDYSDSDVFAVRAQRAARGQTVAPEALSARRLPVATAEELKAARERLVAALEAGARSKAPENSARAQVMFDCWMQEQEENFQPADIAQCRSGFQTEMAAVDAKLAPPPVAKPAPAAKPEPKVAPKPERFVVYFPFGSASLSEESRQVIARAAAAAKKLDAKALFIGGHTDRSGEEDFNNKLSEERANAVARAIRQVGVTSKAINMGFFGESKPAVATDDGVSSRENRRVEIEIRK